MKKETEELKQFIIILLLLVLLEYESYNCDRDLRSPSNCNDIDVLTQDEEPEIPSYYPTNNINIPTISASATVSTATVSTTTI